jgi:hypothetical protein
MMEALSSSEMSVLTRSTQIPSQKIPFFIAPAVKTSNLTCGNKFLVCTVRSKVLIGKRFPHTFLIQNGLKQGDALSPPLFNSALEYEIRQVQES